MCSPYGLPYELTITDIIFRLHNENHLCHWLYTTILGLHNSLLYDQTNRKLCHDHWNPRVYFSRSVDVYQNRVLEKRQSKSRFRESENQSLDLRSDPYLNTCIDYYIIKSSTYDHRLRRIGHPVRSAIHKPQIGELVVEWVTISEFSLSYVCFFCLFCLFWPFFLDLWTNVSSLVKWSC